MLVSVIIPCYNSERYLDDCLQTVLKQTFSNFEIILVDDGSTDSTHQIAKSYNDVRVFYYYKKNGGLSSARNFGITKSKGEIIAFLDSDDIWMPKKLECMLELLKEKDVVFCDYYNIGPDGTYIKPLKEKLHVDFSNEIKEKLLSANVVWGSGSAVMLYKYVIDKVGFFRDDLNIGEDWEYWTRIAWMDFTFGMVNNKLVGIRKNPFSIQNNTKTQVWGQSIDILLKSFLLIPGIKNKEKSIIYSRMAINAYQIQNLHLYSQFCVQSWALNWKSLGKVQFWMLWVKLLTKKLLLRNTCRHGKYSC